MGAFIDSITTLRYQTPSNEDDRFVVARSGRESGWYGPVDAAVASFVRHELAGLVTGAPVEDHRGLHDRMDLATKRCPDVAASRAIGSVDCAVWDLDAQLSQVPVAALLSPTPARQVSLYASWLRLDLEEPASMPMVAEVGRAGWAFTKWGLRRAAGAVPVEEAERLARLAQRVAATLGTAAAFDAVFTWDEAFAVSFVDRVRTTDILWLEDPLPGLDVDAYRALALRVPLATGEQVTNHDVGLAPLSLQLRAFTIDVVGCGGLTRATDLVAEARDHGVKVYPHGRSFAPAVHLAAANPEAIPAVEYRLQWEPGRQRRSESPLVPGQGTVDLPDAPGLGARPRRR